MLNLTAVRVGTTLLVRYAFVSMSPDGQARPIPSTPELGTLEIHEQVVALDRDNWRLREENAALRAGRGIPSISVSDSIPSKESESAKLRAQLEKAQETISINTRELRDAEAAHTAFSQNTETRNKELESKVSVLESTVDKVRSHTNNVESQLKLSQARVKELESQQKETESRDIGEAAHTTNELQSKIAELQSKLQESQAQNKDLENKLESTVQNVKSLESRLESVPSIPARELDDERQDWRKRALDAQFEIAELDSELKAAKKQVYLYSRGPMVLYGRIKECLAAASQQKAESTEKRALEAEAKAAEAARMARQAEAEAEEAIASSSQEIRSARRAASDEVKAAEARASQQISVAESETREMRHRMEAALKSAEASRKSCEDAKSTAQIAVQEREDAVKAFAEAKARKEEAEAEAKTAIREKEAAVAAQIEAESASQRHRLAAESADRRRESAEASLKEFEAVIRRLKADLISAQTAVTTTDRNSREKLADAQARLEKLNDQLESAQEALRRTQGDLGVAQNRITDLESSLQVSQADLLSAKEQVQAQSTVATQLSRSLEGAQRLAGNAEEADRELKLLRTEYQKAIEETEALRRTTADQAVRLRNSPQQLGELQDELLQLREQAQGASSELAQLKGKENERFTKYREALEAEAQNVVSHYERMYRADCELLQRQATDLESRLQETERRLVEAREQLVEARGSSSRTDLQLRELQIEISSLRQALAVAEGGASRLRTEAEGVANMEKQIAAAQHELATYEATARNEIAKRDSELVAKESLFNKATSEIESLKHQLKEAEINSYNALNRLQHLQEIENDNSKLLSRVESLRRAAQITHRYLTAVCSLQSRQIARLRLAKEWASGELRSREARQLEMMRRAQVPPPSKPISLAAAFNTVLAAVRFTRPTPVPEDLALHKVYEHLDKDYLL